jgi:serine/threonine-protein kinase
MSSELDHVEGASLEDEQEQLDSHLQELPKQYELLGKINQGGMGSIYKARNRYTGALYAIKILHPEKGKDNKALRRFVVEARLASSLLHPNICKVHDFGLTESNMPYLVMDWINGITLGNKVMRDGRLSIQEAIRLFQQVSSALSHAHYYKVVHRDLKPDNIMLSRSADGRTEVQLVDFGIAKTLIEEDNSSRSMALTTTGQVIGTPLYMSPEQARSDAVDVRTDIYSLGCVMYFALVGRPPFVGASAMDTIAKHLFDQPPPFDPPLKIPQDLRTIVFKALEKDPKDRYQTMEALSTDLKKLTKGVSIDQGPLSIQRKLVQRRLFIVVCFILGFVVTFVLSQVLQNFLDQPNSHDESKARSSKTHTGHHTVRK